MTQLATLALRRAHEAALNELRARCGAPLAPDGQEAQLWIVGMGKLGAGELNVSSDIDLIYVYDADGESSGRVDERVGGRGRISVQEYFARAVRRITALLAEVTEHGFVFRVDLALRPNGSAGPLAIGLDALEEYLLVQGREWERFAWLKSRVVAPLAALESGSVQALRAVARPFVYRRYLDYNVFEALRALHRRIIAHAALVIREGGVDNLKLGRGGIRDIEFTVQLLQVVRGGQFPELRCRATLDALPRLAQAGLMPAETAARLADDGRYGEEVQRFLSQHGEKTLLDALFHGIPGLRARAICAPYWQAATVVHVYIDTETGFQALGCRYGKRGYEHDAGTCMNADNTPFARGQETFFDLERPRQGNAESENSLRFQLSVTDAVYEYRYTNWLNGTYGEEIRVTLTGSAETGYTIARMD